MTHSTCHHYDNEVITAKCFAKRPNSCLLLFEYKPLIYVITIIVYSPNENASKTDLSPTSGTRTLCEMPSFQGRSKLCGEVSWWPARCQQLHFQVRRGQQRMSSLPRQLHPGVSVVQSGQNSRLSYIFKDDFKPNSSNVQYFYHLPTFRW